MIAQNVYSSICEISESVSFTSQFTTFCECILDRFLACVIFSPRYNCIHVMAMAQMSLWTTVTQFCHGGWQIVTIFKLLTALLLMWLVVFATSNFTILLLSNKTKSSALSRWDPRNCSIKLPLVYIRFCFFDIPRVSGKCH